MTIIINEIEIAVQVVPNQASPSGKSTDSSKEEIIRECVERVMEILSQKNER